MINQIVITSEVVSAFTECPHKATLCLNGQVSIQQASLEAVLEQRALRNRNSFLASQGIAVPDSATMFNDLLPIPERMANAILCHQDLRASIDLLQLKEDGKSWEPFIFIGTVSPSNADKAKLAFGGYVMSLLNIYTPILGTIVTTNGQKRINLSRLFPTIEKTISSLRAILLCENHTGIHLQSRCVCCRFWSFCYSEAVKSGDLSLLPRLGTKRIEKLNRKGIFSIEQLAFTYRPRRKKRSKKNTSQPVYQPALHALAIKERRILIEELSQHDWNKNHLYLDLEGLPDVDFYYLAGVIMKQCNSQTEHSFWADDRSQEPLLLQSLLGFLRNYPTYPILHYGNYEVDALQRLSRRYKTDASDVIARLVNVNKVIYGKIYFPVYSNSLKDIGSHFGVVWPCQAPSSVQPIIWRYLWEDTCLDEYKKTLIQYNLCDCRALVRLVDEMAGIQANVETNNMVEFVSLCKRQYTAEGKRIHAELERLLISGHADFETRKITWTNKSPRTGMSVKPKRKGTRPDRQVRVRRRLKCPKCGGRSISPKEKMIAEAIITDLVFTRNGCRRRITRYYGNKVFCRKCKEYYNPRRLHELKARKYGDGFTAWCVYQRVVCRIPYRIISHIAAEVYGIHTRNTIIVKQVERFGKQYTRAISEILKELLRSQAIHVDETRVSTTNGYAYVWVVTDGKYVLFQVTETREAAPILAKLRGYEGVLVTDFFAGFDSADFRQQKCWAHLIKDLNDVLWKEPFNQELEAFVGGVKDVIVPVIDEYQRFGPKTYHLRKFQRPCAQFYERWIEKRVYATDSVQRFQKRFLRYRESLFRFLKSDGIPWNNNAGERALRHVAVQRKISTAPFSIKALPHYLTLLSIAQTFRFHDTSFLKFLLSGKKNIGALLKRKR
jgi:predicted RecB family nuclease